MDIYERFKYLRKEKKLSQAEFGERVGVTRGVIYNIEKKIVEPKELFVKAVCKEYHVNYLWLTEGIGDIFDNSEDAIIEELAEEYKLDEVDVDIIKSYLQLEPAEREAFKKYLKGILHK